MDDAMLAALGSWLGLQASTFATDPTKATAEGRNLPGGLDASGFSLDARGFSAFIIWTTPGGAQLMDPADSSSGKLRSCLTTGAEERQKNGSKLCYFHLVISGIQPGDHLTVTLCPLNKNLVTATTISYLHMRLMTPARVSICRTTTLLGWSATPLKLFASPPSATASQLSGSCS